MKVFIVLLLSYGFSLAFPPIPLITPDCHTLGFDDCVSYCSCSWELLEEECVGIDIRKEPYYTNVDCFHTTVVFEVLLLDVCVIAFTILSILCYCYSLGFVGFRIFRARMKAKAEAYKFILMEEFSPDYKKDHRSDILNI